MFLSVTSDKDGKSGLLSLDLNELLYLEFIKSENRILVHTLHQTYYTLGTITYWIDAIANAGYELEKVDRSCALHLPKVKILDRNFKVAYFEDQITADSKRCTIAVAKFSELVKNNKCRNAILK